MTLFPSRGYTPVSALFFISSLLCLLLITLRITIIKIIFVVRQYAVSPLRDSKNKFYSILNTNWYAMCAYIRVCVGVCVKLPPVYTFFHFFSLALLFHHSFSWCNWEKTLPSCAGYLTLAEKYKHLHLQIIHFVSAFSFLFRGLVFTDGIETLLHNAILLCLVVEKAKWEWRQNAVKNPTFRLSCFQLKASLFVHLFWSSCVPGSWTPSLL